MVSGFIILGIILMIIGGGLILDGAFSPFNGVLVNLDSGFQELILGVGIMILGGICELVGKARRKKS